MNRPSMLIAALSATLFLSCAGPAPKPQPGMEVIHWNRHGEIQVATDIDWSRYSKVILHTAPVEFREGWRRDQERLAGGPIREEHVDRIRKGVSDQFNKVMFEKLSALENVELTDEIGAGVMLFSPRIVELNITAPGLVQRSAIEVNVLTRGSMRIELVITDAESGDLLAAAWQDLTDPLGGDVASTTSVNNTLTFRRMMQSWADWLLEHLEKAGWS